MNWSLAAIDFARDHRIVMLSLPPHTSHRTQLLGKTVYGPLQIFYYQEIDKWMTSHQGKWVTDYDIAGLKNAAYMGTSSVEKRYQWFQIVWNIAVQSRHI